MTNWTKESDITTSYSEVGDTTTSYTQEGDSSDRYIPFGFGLKVASEDFTWMLTEDKLNRLVHSRMEYTEVDDVSTAYTKVEDA
jgi:hypothetical protein